MYFLNFDLYIATKNFSESIILPTLKVHTFLMHITFVRKLLQDQVKNLLDESCYNMCRINHVKPIEDLIRLILFHVSSFFLLFYLLRSYKILPRFFT